jgi:two-component system chemotaxis response regulator CheV
MADILLESGTNEMELLVFRLDKTSFGINVAKVREIIQRPQTVHLPLAPDAVEGSFKLRDNVLTLINLGKCFGMEGPQTQSGAGLIIIVEFNQAHCGVLVDSVECIHRLRWDQIEPPSKFLTDLKAPITGICRVNEQTVLVADFETIVGEVLGIQPAKDIEEETTPAGEAGVDLSTMRILFADDSATLRMAVTSVLKKSGFTNITICRDGQEAWDALQEHRSDAGGAFDIVISDIEMPRMDGLHLTSRVKQDVDFAQIPVVLFSSLISDDNRKKGQSVGADAQVSKPDSMQMVQAVRQCLEKVGKLPKTTATAAPAATSAVPVTPKSAAETREPALV